MKKYILKSNLLLWVEKGISLIHFKIYLFVLFAFCNGLTVHAQEPLHFYRLEANNLLNEVSWKDSVYLLPQFQQGTLTYSGGFMPEATWLMNYNMYFESMDLLNDAGDTLSVKRIPELKFVHISGRTFYHDYDLGYIELLIKTPVALGVKYIMATVTDPAHKKQLAYIPFDERGYTEMYDRYYIKGPAYYFIDPNNVLHNANQSSILKLYSENKQDIKEYLFRSPVNFSIKEDLSRLLNFCKQFDFFFEKTESPELLRIPAGESISTVPWRKSIYKYPEFKSTRVTLSDRMSFDYPYRMNYNYFSGLLDYIAKNGDTLTIKPSANIRVANLEGDIFCFDSEEGYIELLLHGTISLGVKNFFKVARKEIVPVDSEAVSSSTSSVISFGKNQRNLIVNYDRLYKKTASYFFIDDHYGVFAVNKQMVLLLFPGHKKEIIGYLNKNNTNFKSELDLINLVNFCNQLSPH